VKILSKATKVINVDPEIKDALDKLKLYQKETYNEVIGRLIANQKEGE
jgi:cell fate (sporulation/competence/biofilm development) regulator YmcA (YheA/YmcA/DUF963 family)